MSYEHEYHIYHVYYIMHCYEAPEAIPSSDNHFSYIGIVLSAGHNGRVQVCS